MAQAPRKDTGKDEARAVDAAVRWDTGQLKTTYCNVANATSTREEVMLNFGISQNRDPPQAELGIQLLHRVILSPFAARRLQQLLAKLINEYESRHGELR